MGAYNAGRIPHQQHFYVDDEADAPTKAYVGDKLYIFNTNEQKIWDGEKWVEYGAIVSLSAQQTGKHWQNNIHKTMLRTMFWHSRKTFVQSAFITKNQRGRHLL